MRGARGFPLGFLLVFPLALAANASSVDVNPTRIHLASAERSESLVLHNGGTAPVRFQVTSFDWKQSLSGEMQLGPTSDLSFFPSLLELKPNESRKIRVMSRVPVGATEKTYRLFVDELPPPEGSRASGVQVLTRLGVPVFLQPPNPRAQPVLAAKLEKARLHVTLENTGNSYYVAEAVEVVGRAANGAVVLEQKLPAWYVLARGRRVYDLPVGPEACKKLTSVKLSVKSDYGNATASHTPAAEACSG